MTPPALFIVITPALSPVITPALLPVITPALSPALLPGHHLNRYRRGNHGTQCEARSPYIEQHDILAVNDMHISTLAHAHGPQLTGICHGATDIDNPGMTSNGA